MATNIIRIIPAVVQQEAVPIGRVEMALYALNGDCAEMVARAYNKIDTKRKKRWSKCKVPHVADSCGTCGWRREFLGHDIGARRRAVLLGTEAWLKAHGELPAFPTELQKPSRSLRAGIFQPWTPVLNDWEASALVVARHDQNALKRAYEIMEEKGHRPFFSRVNGVRTWTL